MTPGRVEHTLLAHARAHISAGGGALSGARGDLDGPIDPDLAAVVEARTTLPEGVKVRIVEIVEAARHPDELDS